MPPEIENRPNKERTRPLVLPVGGLNRYRHPVDTITRYNREEFSEPFQGKFLTPPLIARVPDLPVGEGAEQDDMLSKSVQRAFMQEHIGDGGFSFRYISWLEALCLVTGSGYATAGEAESLPTLRTLVKAWKDGYPLMPGNSSLTERTLQSRYSVPMRGPLLYKPVVDREKWNGPVPIYVIPNPRIVPVTSQSKVLLGVEVEGIEVVDSHGVGERGLDTRTPRGRGVIELKETDVRAMIGNRDGLGLLEAMGVLTAGEIVEPYESARVDLGYSNEHSGWLVPWFSQTEGKYVSVQFESPETPRQHAIVRIEVEGVTSAT